MPKAEVLNLVRVLSNEQADLALCDRFYDEVVLDLGKMPILITASIVPLDQDAASSPTSPESSYVLPENAIEALQFVYDDRMLQFATDRELGMFSRLWRSIVGTPQAVYRGDIGSRRFRLVPLPDRPSEPFIFIFGMPMDAAYPQYSVVVFHTDNRQVVPIYLELPIAFFILGREFSRSSDHQDLAFAAQCATSATALLEMAQ